MTRVTAVFVALSLSYGVGLSAQEPDAQWSRVQQLKVGTVIEVTVRDSPPAKRRFVAADASSLEVYDTGNHVYVSETIARSDIVEIKVPKPRSVGRKVALGILGYFAGGMIGGITGGYLTNSMAGLIGAFPGAAVGVFLGVRGGFRRPYEAIYSQ